MMGGIFDGSPQTATSYATSSTETPKWMQDAIYNQIQWAQNIANRPYEEYAFDTVADLSPLQQQAYANVVANQGSWAPGMQKAQLGMEGFSGEGTAQGLRQDQAQYLQPGLAQQGLGAGQQLFGQAAGMDIMGAAQPSFQDAGFAARNIMGSSSPYFQNAGGVDIQGAGAGNFDRAGEIDIVGAADPYLSQASQMSALRNAQGLLSRSAGMDIVGAAQPYMNQAGQATAQSLSERAMQAANPYLQASAKTAASQVGQYMNPYQTGVMDVIAKQGARNLTENIMPGVSDAFIKAGQFGSSRMGEMGSRAIRDTQEAILGQQAQAAQQGYTQALGAAQTDLARQGQLAGTVGSISGADLSRIMQGGSQYGNLAQTAGQLTGQQMQNLLANAQATGQMTTADQAALANIGQTYGQLSSQQMANLTNLGQAQTSAAAQQAANQLNVGQAFGQAAGQQAGALTNLGQSYGQLTGQQMQNLANIGQMQTQAGQGQQQFGLSAAQVAQGAEADDYRRQMSALQQMAAMAQQEQGMRAADVASLETAGAAQQAQNQRDLDAARAQDMEAKLYPQQQMDWLNTQIRGMAPITPQTQISSSSTTGATYNPSPLSQLATGLYTYKGLQNMG